MNNLKELIGKKVQAIIGKNKIECKVIDVNINDFYFIEKSETIQITVNLEPLNDLPKDFDFEMLSDVSLENLVRYI